MPYATYLASYVSNELLFDVSACFRSDFIFLLFGLSVTETDVMNLLWSLSSVLFHVYA